LLRKPFELSPDSNVFFLGETQKKALSVLKQGVVEDKGFVLFTGGVGTGKTTLINVLSQTLDNPGYLCVISNPTLEIDEFFYYFAAQLGLLFDGNKAKFLFLFSKLLEQCRKKKRKVLLIIDEAHALPTDLLEELRLLVNMAEKIQSALCVFLVGQPELSERLTEKQLSCLNNRVAVCFHLDQFSQEDTLHYVSFRLGRAGAKNNSLFSESALELVYQATGGNPRLINILCDKALLGAYSKDRIFVDENMIRECVEQLYIPGDEDTFFLSPVKPFWHKWVFWLLLAIFITEITAGIYAYSNGWLQLAYQYVKGLLNFG
jgi:general secretion pathway protein A